MSKNDILVVKCHAPADNKDLARIRDSIIAMKKDGVVVLPWYCDAIIVPKDIDIRVESQEEVANHA